MLPPEGKEELAVFRRSMLGLSVNPEDAGEFDLVVVGGGIAGVVRLSVQPVLDVKSL